MKLFLTTIIILLSNGLLGQNLLNQKAEIDIEVTRIALQKKVKTTSFPVQALKKSLHYITYQYVGTLSGYIKISRQFSYKNDTIQQAFYIKRGELIFATEKITSYFGSKTKDDSIVWSGDFYFANGKLIDHITLGHGKSELETWNPEQEILRAFSDSKKDIARYRTKKNSD